MALIKCPDCGTECSDQAPACPKCARPLSGQKSIFTKDLGFGGFIYALMLIGGFGIGVQGSLFGWILAIAGGLLLLARLKISAGVGRK